MTGSGVRRAVSSISAAQVTTTSGIRHSWPFSPSATPGLASKSSPVMSAAAMAPPRASLMFRCNPSVADTGRGHEADRHPRDQLVTASSACSSLQSRNSLTVIDEGVRAAAVVMLRSSAGEADMHMGAVEESGACGAGASCQPPAPRLRRDARRRAGARCNRRPACRVEGGGAPCGAAVSRGARRLSRRRPGSAPRRP